MYQSVVGFNTAILSLADTSWGFVPDAWICLLFIGLFALTTIVHTIQALFFSKPRMWWLLVTICMCGLLEMIGWGGRYWGNVAPFELSPYLLQMACTVIAPSFLTAAMFRLFVNLIVLVGPEYSRITPGRYSICFFGVDLAALIIQAAGGAVSAICISNSQPDRGSQVMLAGIMLQMLGMTFYAGASVEYVWRVYNNRPVQNPYARDVTVPTWSGVTLAYASMAERGFMRLNDPPKSLEKVPYTETQERLNVETGRDRLTPNVKIVCGGLALSTILIYIRSMYRTVELLDHWTGPIITDQILLDALPVILTMITLNIFHPSRLHPPPESDITQKTSKATNA